MPTQTEKSDGRPLKVIPPLCAVATAALALRLLVRFLDPALSRDSIRYIEFARDWHDASGGVSALLDAPGSIMMMPLFMYIMQLPVYLGFTAEASGVIVNMALGSLLPVWVYAIGRQLAFSREMSLMAAVLAALHPALVGYSIEAQRECLYLFLCSAVLWCLLFAINRRSFAALAGAGIGTAAAALARIEGLELLATGLLAVILSCCDAGFRWKRLMAGTLIFAAAFATALAALILLMEIPPGQLWQVIDWRLKTYAGGLGW